MKITIDTSKLNLPTSNDIRKATYRAINHTTAKAATAASVGIRSEWNLKASYVKDAVAISKATTNKQEASYRFRSRSISLINFRARQIKKGVSYKLKKRGGTKKIKGAFITTTKGGYKGVFIRKGKSRLPLAVFKSVTPTTMFKQYGEDKFQAVISSDMGKRFNHELERLMK